MQFLALVFCFGLAAAFTPGVIYGNIRRLFHIPPDEQERQSQRDEMIRRRRESERHSHTRKGEDEKEKASAEVVVRPTPESPLEKE